VQLLRALSMLSVKVVGLELCKLTNPAPELNCPKEQLTPHVEACAPETPTLYPTHPPALLKETPPTPATNTVLVLLVLAGPETKAGGKYK